MKRIILTILVLVAVPGVSFSRSVTTPNTFTAGTTAVAASVNANFVELEAGIDDNDLRIDALLTTDTCTSPPCDLTAGTTLGGASVLTSSTDYLASTAIGVTVQAYDADLTDLADGSLSGSKIGTGLDAAIITTGTIGSTSRLPAAVIELTEIDTTTELNALFSDDVFIRSTDTVDLDIVGSAAFTGTLQGLVFVQTISTTTSSPDFLLTRGNLHICTNAGGCDITLPGASAGRNACWYDANGGGVITLDPATGDAIILDGVTQTLGDAIDSAGARGDFVCILAIDSTYWITLGRSGTFIPGGAD